MRRLWTGKSRSRLSLVVAAVSVITLAASSPIYSAVSRGHFTGSTSGRTITTVAGTCTRATASRVATRLHVGVDPISHRTPIFQVLCGSFFGPGSRGMAASIAVSAGCGGSIGWAVFRYAGGTWRLVMQQRNGAFLSKAGSDIQEKIGVLQPGDDHCSPSAWKSRIWHWRGSRFTVSPWKLTPTTTVRHLIYFRSPSHNIWCDVGDEGKAYCVSRSLPHSVTLEQDGTVTICNGAHCVDNDRLFGSGTPVLAYGQQDAQAGFRCKSARSGISCTVSHPGQGHGNGFLINSASVSRIGP
jgi:hypothetical protein